MAGPTASPVEAEEIVASGATAAPYVSRPRQASLGPRRFASIRRLRRAHRGPGGYCQHSGNQGTTGWPARAHSPLQKISLRTRLSKPGEALQAWRAPPRVFSLGEGPLLERAPSQRLGEASSLTGFPCSGSQLCLRSRGHMGFASSAESRARQRAVTSALSLPFLCIKQSTKQRQAKELQGLPFR